jgi:hypothetical protein
MNGKSFGLLQLLLLALATCGGWLALGSARQFIAGSALILVASAGLIFLARRENSRPFDEREAEVWEATKRGGRRGYIRRSVIAGLFLGVVSSSAAVLTRENDVSFSAWDVGLFVALVSIITFGCYYAAVRMWETNEQRSKRL